MKVLKLQVKAADKLQLFKATKGEAYAEKFAELLGCLEFLELHDAKEKIDITVLDKVYSPFSFINPKTFILLMSFRFVGSRRTDSKIERCYSRQDARKWYHC